MTASLIKMSDFEKSKEIAVDVEDESGIQAFFSQVEDDLFELCNTLQAMWTKEQILDLISSTALGVHIEPDCLGVHQFFASLDESEFAYMMGE